MPRIKLGAATRKSIEADAKGRGITLYDCLNGDLLAVHSTPECHSVARRACTLGMSDAWVLQSISTYDASENSLDSILESFGGVR